jgi:hypothetical protein
MSERARIDDQLAALIPVRFGYSHTPPDSSSFLKDMVDGESFCVSGREGGVRSGKREPRDAVDEGGREGG